jgi:hypothetical protein
LETRSFMCGVTIIARIPHGEHKTQTLMIRILRCLSIALNQVVNIYGTELKVLS